MILQTDSIFLTNEIEGFVQCRETRSEKSASVILVTAGYMDLFFRNEMIRVNKSDIFIRVPHATKLGPYQFSEDLRFMEIVFPIEIFENLMYGNMRIEPNWWAKQEYLKRNPIFHLTDKSIEFCETYFHLLTLQLQDRQSDYRKHILMNVARCASMELLNYMDKTVDLAALTDRSSVNASDYTFRNFTQLLRDFPHEREVQWYAAKLDITPKYLSEICKERSGKSASEWIAETTVSELKHYLRETTLPIHQIAVEMEFPNASFFCQYTKKHLGMTPNHYRRAKQV